MSGNAVKRLSKDMKANGFDASQPIQAADADGKIVIIDGHHRTQAAIRAGVREVPVTVGQTTKSEADKLLIEAAEALGEGG